MLTIATIAQFRAKVGMAKLSPMERVTVSIRTCQAFSDRLDTTYLHSLFASHACQLMLLVKMPEPTVE